MEFQLSWLQNFENILVLNTHKFFFEGGNCIFWGVGGVPPPKKIVSKELKNIFLGGGRE